MAIYKGIEIGDDLVGIIRHMQGVEEYREVLGNLQSAWDTLTLLGQLSGTAAEMSSTREAFQQLTGDLLNHLALETRNTVTADLRAKAQNAIDILVRNLFERTADIGFLAADDDLREFLATPDGDRAPVEQRFREYVAKYSVYADIILFTADGQVAARLDTAQSCRTSHAPLIQESMGTSRLYVEYYGPVDFMPPGDHLIYAYRVTDSGKRSLGVLALAFRLGDEMEGIFGKLIDNNASAGSWAVLACLTQTGQVVASSCAMQLPPGMRIQRQSLSAEGGVIRLAGREYLAVACPPHGYQGYSGPGWIGLGLLPLEFAFDRDDSTLLSRVNANILDAVMQQPSLFSDTLRNIPQRADRIQADLNRSVWNGSVRQVDEQSNAAFSKTLLWEIADAGRKTQAVFELSIGNLHRTVVAAILQDTLSRASFAIDVMDRNLYERANDCRWWALNATFRQVLASAEISPQDANRCAEILTYINDLYTVYENLILFDSRGVVIAVSRPAHAHLVGRTLGEEWVARSLAIPDTQGYVVSRFVPTPLYQDRHTHIYAAAVRDPAGARTVGGVAIVFDAAPQFAAMLADALPRNDKGDVVDGAIAAFIDAEGRVVASTSPTFPIGNDFPLPLIQQGAHIAPISGRYYAIGEAPSRGYREYKVSDGYRNDVTALCAFPLGEVVDLQRLPLRKPATNENSRVRRSGTGRLEFATFHVSGRWLGVPASDVVEAVDATGLTPPSGSENNVLAGYRMHRDRLITVIRIDRLLDGIPPSEDARQVVILRTRGKQCIGLLVDRLGEIPEVDEADIQPVQRMVAAPGLLVKALVNNLYQSGDGDTMLSILDTDQLCIRLGCHGCDEGEEPKPIALPPPR